LTQFRYDYAARTDKGPVRSSNQDAFGTLPEDGVVVVADGMGGYSGGEVASRLAVDTLLQEMLRGREKGANLELCLDRMEQAVELANLAILGAADHSPELKGMGTTIVLGAFLESDLAFAWVGDSRLYLLRDRRLVQLTDDHTLVQELVEKGLFESKEEAIQAGVGENLLTHAVGAEESLPISTSSMETALEDIYLFCTDGLTHMVNDRDIEQVMTDGELSLDAKADRMIQLACEGGGMDNITVILVSVAAAEASARAAPMA
jgi:protein phosphatase